MAPDGTVTLVTGAGRGSAPDPLRDPAPDRPAGLLPLELHVTSWVFPRGHRIRLAHQQRPVADDLADTVPGHGHAASGPD